MHSLPLWPSILTLPAPLSPPQLNAQRLQRAWDLDMRIPHWQDDEARNERNAATEEKGAHGA